jgi:TatD DNase family protein
MDDQDILIYPIGESLYLNLTNRCTAACRFCRRKTSPIVAGYDLRLVREHPAAEYIAAINNPLQYAEIVFCGYGEPTLRLSELLEIARELKTRGARLRLNTNGHGNLIHGRNIVPDLAPLLDEISISVNAPDALTYEKLVLPAFGILSFESVVRFVRSCIGQIPSVVITAVAVPELDLEACLKLAQELKVRLSFREYQ